MSAPPPVPPRRRTPVPDRYEILNDPATGEPLASVCLSGPITDEERAVLVEYYLLMRKINAERENPSA